MKRSLPLLAALLFALPQLSFPASASSGAGAQHGSLTRLESHIMRLAAHRLVHHTASQVATWLTTRSAVRFSSAGRDARTVDITFRDGVQAAVLPALSTRIALRPDHRIQNLRLRPFSEAASPSGRAAVLEPFAAELQLGPHAGDVEVSDLQAAGFQVDQLYDTAVTVGTMGTLSQYNVIYLHTHSGVNRNGGSVVASGEPANGDPSVAPLLNDGSVIVVGVAGSDQQYYGITTRFLQLHEGGFLPNSFMFVNGCSLLSTNDFWNAVAAKGLGALVSWDNESTSHDNFLAAAAFFNEMDQGLTIAQSVKGVVDAGYGKSIVNGQTATLGYLGNGSITLASAQQQGGSTATPTATTIPTPATPTPTASANPTPTTVPTSSPTLVPPTSTPASIPPPPLAVSLKAAVAPGKKQTVKIHTAPKIRVLVVASFPNGEALSLATTSDGSGAAVVSFEQRSSTIKRGHVFAKVVITAGNALSNTVGTRRYHILWAPLDVSAVPRSLTRGEIMTIDIHSRPGRNIHASIAARGHTVTRFSGKVGAGGWYMVRYRVPSRFSAGTHLTVKASTTVGRTTYRTSAGVSVR